MALILMAASGRSATSKTNTAKTPKWFIDMYINCYKNLSEEKCKKNIKDALQTKGRLWANSNDLFVEGSKQWFPHGLTIKLTKNKTKEGEFFVNLTKEGPKPELEISLAYPITDLLITISHEITHFSNSKDLKDAIPHRKEMVKSCINKYEHVVLLDESKAFKNELDFWNASPSWFKNYVEGIKFNSKLIGRDQITYKQLYQSLGLAIKRDPEYPAKRYIQMGHYPKCAGKLI